MTKKNLPYIGISKTKTFIPAAKKKHLIYVQALHNLEAACLKAQRHHLKAKKLTLLLRHHNFQNDILEIKLSHPTASHLDLVEPFTKLFDLLFHQGAFYRSVSVVLGDLSTNHQSQPSFFKTPLHITQVEKLATAAVYH